jgi:hypothetical protein
MIEEMLNIDGDVGVGCSHHNKTASLYFVPHCLPRSQEAWSEVVVSRIASS